MEKLTNSPMVDWDAIHKQQRDEVIGLLRANGINPESPEGRQLFQNSLTDLRIRTSFAGINGVGPARL